MKILPTDTERAGFASRAFRKSLATTTFLRNHWPSRGLAHSDSIRSFPVVPRPEGGRPGQIRDKFVRDGIAKSRPLFPPPGPGRSRSNRPSTYRRRGSRRRQDILADRARLKEQTEREIDAIHAEYAQLTLGRPHTGVAAIYARYSTEFQQSVGDQIRACLEEAARLGLVVDRAHIFYDLAVSGMKERRPGLDQVRSLFAAKGA
ncbi:MAG TPA: recombinase family protein, partial [Gemmataceae bacterium]|nr:recombinase family protein [Gemmataceae bacterium]